jgi:hypothetical protein
LAYRLAGGCQQQRDQQRRRAPADLDIADNLNPARKT